MNLISFIAEACSIRALSTNIGVPQQTLDFVVAYLTYFFDLLENH